MTVTCVTYQALYQYFRTDTAKLLAYEEADVTGENQ